MKLSQKRAISYAISKRNEAKRQSEINKIGVNTIYKYQNIYKKSYHFLNAVRRGRLVALYNNAVANVENALKSVENNFKCYYGSNNIAGYNSRVNALKATIGALYYELNTAKLN